MKSKLNFTFAILLLTTSAAQAQDWGSLKAKFILDGKAPIPEKVNVNKDIEICGKFKLVDEKFRINAETGAIQNVVIYLSPKPGAPKPTIHPDYAKAPVNVVLDNKNCRFEPHILPMLVTQTLAIKNSEEGPRVGTEVIGWRSRRHRRKAGRTIRSWKRGRWASRMND